MLLLLLLLLFPVAVAVVVGGVPCPLGGEMLAKFVGDFCNALWFLRAVCLMRGVVTVASFMDVFEGVVTVATGTTVFTGDLLLLLLLLLTLLLLFDDVEDEEGDELMTNLSGGTTPSLFFSATPTPPTTAAGGKVVVIVGGGCDGAAESSCDLICGLLGRAAVFCAPGTISGCNGGSTGPAFVGARFCAAAAAAVRTGGCAGG